MQLEEVIGYRFKEPKLLMNALTHSSYANEHKKEGEQSNERLEFLGDSVLGMVSAEYLFKKYPDEPEGKLTRTRAALVCEDSLQTTANALELWRWLRLGKGEIKNNGNHKPSILADAVEAIIAAIYLDGGREKAEEFIFRFILSENSESNSDYKTLLQEKMQRTPGHTVSYEPVEESGPAHQRRFTVRVLLDGQEAGRGEGRSKKEAEQQAAKQALGFEAPKEA